MKEYVGIYIKTEKAQEQNGFGNKMKYHFHIRPSMTILSLSYLLNSRWKLETSF